MKKFLSWLHELTKDERNRVSIKPVIAMIGTFFLCFTLVIDTLSKCAYTPSDAIIEAIVIITTIGMGADSLDKFSLKQKLSSPPETKKPNTHEDPEV